MVNDDITIRITVWVKGYLIRIIINTEINVLIVIYFIIKKLQLTMKPANGSQIITIDQQRKMIKEIIKETSLMIANARIPITLLVIDNWTCYSELIR